MAKYTNKSYLWDCNYKFLNTNSTMKKIIGLFLVFQLSVPVIFACTNFLVGKKASTDGSTMISYSADSYNLYG